MSPRSVLIAGANKGLGLGFVKQFLQLPSPPEHIFATCRDPSNAEALHELTKSNPSVKILKLDVNDLSSIQEANEKVEATLQGQGLNVLLNNGAIHITKSWKTVTGDDMQENFKTNAVGPLLTVQTFLPLLKQAAEQNKDKDLCWDREAIFNISSVIGSIEETTIGSSCAYRVSKVALNMVTRILSVDLEEEGILAASFHPGWVKTEMGGANALVTPEQSSEALLHVFAKVDKSNKGHMIDSTGKVMPW